MAVFRVERTGDYTVMSNFHLKDKRLSLKAKGLLSQMLSLPDDWDYTLSGLSYINRESKDAIRSAVNELETAGYIRRRQTTDASGKFAANEYTIFERPIEGEPMLDKPLSENPITVNPSAVNPLPENPTQLNTKKSNTQKQNTHGSNTDSIPFRETAAVIPPERKGRDAMSVTEIENYRELILENIEYDCLKQRYPLYLDDLNEIVELLVETVCGTKCSIGVQTGKKADGSPAVQMVEMLFIPEGDLYRLIAHSKLPSAERFEQWVFDEVLPAIRKHGAYLTKEKLWEIATSPEALIKLCSELLAEREENASLREENALLESKAAFYDLFIDLNHSTNLRTTAKELLVPERRFVRFLLEKRFVYRTASGNVLPYAKPANEGLFCVKDYCNHGHIGSYTLITPQGKLYFAQLRDMILMVV
jgi:phage antirepressor YoqD-like protein